MTKFEIEPTKNGFRFNSSDVSYRTMGLEDKMLASEQIKNNLQEDEAIVYFTCANVAYTKIATKEPMYDTFSLDEIDSLVFYCLDVYRKNKERRPFDGTIKFESYIINYVLKTGRQKYATSKATDNDHLVSTAKNASGEYEYYGSNGKMVQFFAVEDNDIDIDRADDGFEDQVINKIDAEKCFLDQKIMDKLNKSHPLIKIVLRLWIQDCKDEMVPLNKYATDERVISLAIKDTKCAKYVLQDVHGNKYINSSTISKCLYKFQNQLKKDEVQEIIRFGINIDENPYLKSMVG